MIGIALGFVLIASLVLWFIIGSKGHWLSKAAIILLSLYFCMSVGLSVGEFMGWPTDEKMPDKFLVHWVVVDEPDPKLGDEGSIYIWIQPLEKSEDKRGSWNDYLLSFYDGDSQPRSYRLPYSRELHERAQEALGMIMRGEGVGGTGEGKGKMGAAKGNSKKQGKGGGSLTRNGGVMFHKLPPPQLPDKEGY